MGKKGNDGESIAARTANKRNVERFGDGVALPFLSSFLFAGSPTRNQLRSVYMCSGDGGGGHCYGTRCHGKRFRRADTF